MKIILIERCKSSNYGECFLLHLEDKNQTSYRVWSPSRLIKQIKKDRQPDQNVYITSLGTQKINAVKSRNEFEISFFADGSPITNLFQDDPSPIKGKACESSPYNLVWSFFIVANYLYLFARSSNTFTVHQFPYSCVVVYLAALPLDENQTTEIVFTTQYLVCSGFSTRATT